MRPVLVPLPMVLPFLLVACTPDFTGFTGKLPEADADDPVPEVTPKFVQFGELRRTESTTSVVQVANAGGSLLDVEEVSIVGDPAFTLGTVAGLPAELANGQLAGVPVTFAPTTGGDATATLVFRFAEHDAPPLEVPLAGRGATPGMRTDPADLVDLGERLMRCPAAALVTLTSTGREPLTIDRVDLVDAGPGLALGAPPEVPVELAQGFSLPVSVAFTPAQLGEVTGTLVIHSNDPADPDGERRLPITASAAPMPEWSDTFSTPTDWAFDVLVGLDHSCSMSDNMPGIADELVAFTDRLGQVKASWHLGVLDGRDPACLVGGVLDPTQPDWADVVHQAVEEPDSASLVNTEALLQATAGAYPLDAPGQCNEGFRTPGAELHVIVLSDERDQSLGAGTSPNTYWQSYVNDLAAWAGDRDLLKFHAIVDTTGACGDEPKGPGGYLEASLSTHGGAYDLCNGHWADALQLVAAEIADRVGRFVLTRDDISAATVKVEVNGTELTSGWTYDPDGPAVLLSPPPDPGSTVVVRYGLLTDCTP